MGFVGLAALFCYRNQYNAPHRKGAALTYLVGMAVKHDLDAPNKGALPQVDDEKYWLRSAKMTLFYLQM
jgi:hypothetical protein